jgi:hypothetical protein
MKRSLAFFKALLGSNPFKCTKEQQQAFSHLKDHLQDLETLISPTHEGPLPLYITVNGQHHTSTEVVREGKLVRRYIENF